MVVRIIAISLLLSLSLSAKAERQVYDAESLKYLLENRQNEKQRAGDRFKASRGSLKSLSLLQNKDIHYKLPNGNYVQGVLLPNGKVAPAIKTKKEFRPACVTIEMELVPGAYDEMKKLVHCELAPSELAIITDSNSIQQSGIEAKKLLQVSTKYGNSSTEAFGIGTPHRNNGAPEDKTNQEKTGNHSTPKRKPANPNVYRPPSRNSTSSKSLSGVIQQDKNKFGVPIGTWVEAELLRSVSSAETGLIEYMTLTDIQGRYQVFPAGTVLFAEKSINEAERRLESITVTARLPNNDEVEGVSFRVYSLDRTAGLSGRLLRDRQNELVAASKTAGLDAVSSAAISSSNGAIGTAVNSVKGNLTAIEQRYSQGPKKAIIKVTPQKVLLKLTKKF